MSAPLPIRPRNPDRTRRRLLRAAVRLFAARGYDGVAVDEIVAAARVNKRMVYHYFGSKEDIYRAALYETYHLADGMEFRAVGADGTPREKLARLLGAFFDFLDRNPAYVRLLLWENLAQGRHIAGRGHLLSKAFLVRFREIVADGMAAGEFRADVDPAQLLVNFIGLCFIYHSNRYSLSQGLNLDLGDPAVRARGLKQVLALVFEGIGARGAGNQAKPPAARKRSMRAAVSTKRRRSGAAASRGAQRGSP